MKIYKYKGYSIELVGFTIEPLYLIYDSSELYKGQATSIQEAKQYINDYLL